MVHLFFDLWENYIAEARQQMLEDEAAFWAEQKSNYGHLSCYDFLKTLFQSTDAITDFLMVGALEPVLHVSYIEVLGFAIALSDTKFSQIVGGMDNLPNAFMPHLEDNIHFDAEVITIDYTEESVTIHYKNEMGERQISGDFAIITLPFSALRFVDVLTPFSRGKQIALRQLRYIEVLKVLLQFKHRFWETEDGIYGGNTPTDLPNQQIYYPERQHTSNRGVLIGTYTYGVEAKHWASLPEEERVKQTLKYVSKIHPQATTEFEIGTSKVWGQDRYAAGVSMYYADEHRTLFPHTHTPEGAIHFAGEHTSYKHGWIEGAVESGLRAAHEISERIASA